MVRMLVTALAERAGRGGPPGPLTPQDDWVGVARRWGVQMTLDEVLYATKLPMKRGDLARFVRQCEGFRFDAETFCFSLR